MWVFDGEQWIQEGASSDTPKPATMAIPIEEFVPELQVVEVVQVPQRNHVPPFPHRH